MEGESSRLRPLRHSASHIMAQAVLELFPDAKLGIGPAIDDGFYYDFDLPRALTPEDLPVIESRMRESIENKAAFVHRELSVEEALKLFAAQPYKLELVQAIARGELGTHGEAEGHPSDTVSIYSHNGFTDLCAGPHVADTGKVPLDGFRLTNIAGAYWRGDEKRPQLQRIYGTAWESKEQLDDYLWKLEEAKKRDHRKLGRELGLFYFSDDVGPGLPLFAPKGELLRYLLESYVRETQTKYGYQHVWTGHLVKEELYKKSGHYDNYIDSMFPPMQGEEMVLRLKPMNCPSHMTLYKEMGRHSYRELPLRFAEFCTLYRYEKRGELTGLTRVGALTQDDCHIFCTEEQIESEFTLALNLVREILGTYDFRAYKVRLSLRGGQGKYVQDDEKWTKATQALKSALDANQVEYFVAEGEAAFYGPKADFLAKDVIGREWQLSTLQVDFIQPARLGLEYVGEDGLGKTPVMLHRAVMGSTERFLAVIIEHYAGAFPLWLAPVQAEIIPIADRHFGYARQVEKKLQASGLRVQVDERSERMNAKIRDAQLMKIPYMLVVGDKEAASNAVAVRLRTGEDLKGIPLEQFAKMANQLVEARSKELKA
jgi:threonyl-tRNA synthetase